MRKLYFYIITITRCGYCVAYKIFANHFCFKKLAPLRCLAISCLQFPATCLRYNSLQSIASVAGGCYLENFFELYNYV